MLFDWNTKINARSRYVTATTLYPLWALAHNACGLRLFEESRQVGRLVEKALAHLEQPGGLASTGQASADRSRRALAKKLGRPAEQLQRQWDFPHGWAPHQVLAWAGLRGHGFTEDANRLTRKWLSMIAQNARDYHGTVPEKFDVAKRSHRVFAEYGNVGTEFAYITEEGFGWMNASFQVGLAALPQEQRDALRMALIAASAAAEQ